MRSQSGYSFVEVCVALSVLGVAASASFLGTSAEQRVGSDARQEASARRLASSILERARAAARDGDPYDALLRDDRASALTNSAGTRSLVWRPSPESSSYASAEFSEAKPGLVALRVIVSWRPRLGVETRRLEATTWIAVEAGR